MSDMQCPYCGADQEVIHDGGHGYAEGVKWEHTCTECKKSFVFETSIVLYYEPAKADCLNDAEHTYKATSTIPLRATRMHCTVCDHERQPTDAEWAEILPTTPPGGQAAESKT